MIFDSPAQLTASQPCFFLFHSKRSKGNRHVRSQFPRVGNDPCAKKGVSPARNIIGLVLLLAFAAVAWLEYSANFGYNGAVKALEARTQDEEKGLMEVQEAETLLGKSPDGPGIEVEDSDSGRTFTKKTYTWLALLRPRTLTAFYTKEATPHLHHFETQGAKYVEEPNPLPPVPGQAPDGPRHHEIANQNGPRDQEVTNQDGPGHQEGTNQGGPRHHEVRDQAYPRREEGSNRAAPDAKKAPTEPAPDPPSHQPRRNNDDFRVGQASG